MWRIEKMDLAPLRKSHYGDFYTGDSYIVLHTSAAPSYNIHSWIGIGLRFSADTSKQTLAYCTIKFPSFVCLYSLLFYSHSLFFFFTVTCYSTGAETSQDEKGCVAIFMTQLDDYLNGQPLQFTEWQNQESDTFMGYFKCGIKYKVKHDIFTYVVFMVNHLKHIFIEQREINSCVCTRLQMKPM